MDVPATGHPHVGEVGLDRRTVLFRRIEAVTQDDNGVGFDAQPPDGFAGVLGGVRGIADLLQDGDDLLTLRSSVPCV